MAQTEVPGPGPTTLPRGPSPAARAPRGPQRPYGPSAYAAGSGRETRRLSHWHRYCSLAVALGSAGGSLAIDQLGLLLDPLVLGEWATDVGLDVLNVTPLAWVRPAWSIKNAIYGHG